jgi:probable HAF family extracellular repeat protein
MKTTVEQTTTLTKQSGASAGQPSFEVVDLGPFDNNRNDVQALNDRGQMAGVSLNPGTGRIEAFTQESGERKSLGTLGGSFSIARAINNGGEIVGGSLTEGDENFHGFLFRGNRL